MGVDYRKAKERTKAIWSLGDYRSLAMLLEPAAHELVGACGITAGQDVLDVAAGNGNCAMAARRGARVVASDLTSALVQLGRARTRPTDSPSSGSWPTPRRCPSRTAALTV